jgi:hypothetical protein
LPGRRDVDASRQRVADASTGARAFAGVRHTLGIDARAGGWQAAGTCTSGRQICGVPHVCGGSNVFGGGAVIASDHEYASRRAGPKCIGCSIPVIVRCYFG